MYKNSLLEENNYICATLAIHQLNPFDLVQDKVVACFQCTDHGSVSAVVVVGGSYGVEAIHCVLVSHEGDDAIDQLRPFRFCVRRSI